MSNKKIQILMFCIVYLSISFVPLHSAEPLLIDDNLDFYEIGKNIEYFEDVDRKLTYEDVNAETMQWKKSEKSSVNFGFTPSAYWLKFSINSQQHKQKGFFLEISYPMIDFIELHIQKKSGEHILKKTGDHYPFYDREIVDRNYIFSLLPEQGVNTYYMRFETASSLNFVPKIWSYPSYVKRVNTEFPPLWIYYGLMIVMVLYNLFLSLSIREIRYVYYSMFITFFILLQLTLNGFAFQYLWPNSIWWANNCLPFFMCSTILFAGLFARSYLNTKINFPRLDKLILYGVLFPTFIWAIGSLLFSYRISIIIATGLTIPTAFVLYGSGAIGLIYRVRAGRFIVIGFTMLVLGVALFVLKTFGVLPTNFLTQWSIQIGSSLIVILLSLGLADEINVMKDNLQVLNADLEDMNNNLENKVKERTSELELARDSLWGEMQLAKKIQTVLLPKHPKIDGFEISAYMDPADSVGGDYYDIINVADQDWVVIGDVSGHGVPAGIIMMMVQTSIHTAVNQNANLSPAELLEVINKTITMNIRLLDEDKYMTITVFAAHQDGVFYFSGLHQDIMIYRSQTNSVEMVETNGIWIGLVEDIGSIVSNDMLTVHKGDTMLIYTDGITEAWEKGSVKDERDPETQMYGDERLKEIFCTLGKETPDNIKNSLLDSLKNYTSLDDITFVILKRTA